MTITLFHCPETRSMRSLWLLNELEIPFEVHEMPFDLKVLRGPEYLAVHPLGRIPALRDGDMTMYESGAIAQYLTETYPNGKGLGRDPGNPERPHFLQWMHYGETILVHGASLVQQWVFIGKEERSAKVIELESKRIGKGLEVIDSVLAKQDWLLAGGFSAADTQVGFGVYFLTAFVAMDTFPNVQRYLERIMARPAFIKSQPRPDAPLAWLKPILGPVWQFKK
jgi:glutathione S-transferase